MANPIELVKAHPVAAVTTVVVVFVAVMLLTSGGGEESYSTQSSGGSGQDAAIAMQQLAGQQQSEQFAISAQRDVELAGQETARYVANLASMSNSAEIAANLELGKIQIERSSTSTDLANTLAAKISGDQIAANTAAMNAQYSTLAAQIASNAAIASSSINAQVAVAKISKPKKGLFSKIFG